MNKKMGRPLKFDRPLSEMCALRVDNEIMNDIALVMKKENIKKADAMRIALRTGPKTILNK